MTHVLTARYGFLRALADFVTSDQSFRRSEWVVLRTERGTEIGDVLVGPRPIPEGRTPDEFGQVLRRASPEDMARRCELNCGAAVAAHRFCRERIAALGLPMRLVAVEHLFGGEKIVFYFTAEARVDFRQLVKELAREYRTRIEMKQIGIRDSARLLGDVGHCGEQLCCGSFLRGLEPVTMRMAKSQKATLDPSKISGVCGRLMCCLRYEDETYRELKKLLPEIGCVFRTRHGLGEVVAQELLARKVALEFEGGIRLAFRADELAPDALVCRRSRKAAHPDGEAVKAASAGGLAAGGEKVPGMANGGAAPGEAEEAEKAQDGPPCGADENH